ncbi:hypothetical protein HanRHA438_Chr06g0266751 [Helianthus annuus]|uniref:Uncharacterized protein n=1 Tax=Helianthus annuus TaxID=4232 RepID=A0A251UIK1_HELAN|nr:UPF0481 protein At3g47200 [Helianthus annuus]KAF5802268.1 hypothetical protein HanXRQr2_Chr06g0257571 [Helianthus annuus]KAJ0560414.1 hypothetical protein HanHA300_Chr06g0211111 [Helianthus annuus]KAJ0573444.1 hypothetical protein HanHA89_Chr06g0226811 [Helianthus annuus]KAJ0740709.1 hypothetical protein HanOQP8_Chr06g0219801 [Helianthus annuus]KAJ0911762.1 hypothetical protein HanRHA438_Chr06g0266751 [Helianthus annuus]
MCVRFTKEPSNALEKERSIKMAESEHVVLEIPCNRPDDHICSEAMEWVICLTGQGIAKSYEREGRMEKVPPLLLKSEKGRRNSECYEPAVVSIGPYHHNRPALARAEKYKLITLEQYCLRTKETIKTLYNTVFEVVHDARKCYIDGSTDAYSDHEFNQMMLRDACFILLYIELMPCAHTNVFLNNEYLGAIGFANIKRDLLLLENQIPFVVLEVLLKLRFPRDKGEEVLNKFFNYLNYGEVMMKKDKKVLEYKRPLHLLELYRSYFISLPTQYKTHENFNYVKQNRAFASVTELKARWIFLRCTSDESTSDMEFNSYCCYGEFMLAPRAVCPYTKAIYLNMIAYEMCPHTPNDLRISTYIRVMKSLILQRADVKELLRNNILLHSLGSDEEVVKMYDEFEVPAVNYYMFNQLRLGIEKLNERKYKTWVAELITDYFGSPWKALGSLVATAILVTSFVQTYCALKPRD